MASLPMDANEFRQMREEHLQRVRETAKDRADKEKREKEEEMRQNAAQVLQEMKRALFETENNVIRFETTRYGTRRSLSHGCIAQWWLDHFDELQRTFYETHDPKQWSLKRKGWIFPYVELRVL